MKLHQVLLALLVIAADAPGMQVVSGSLTWEVRVTGRCSGGKQDNRAIQDRGEGNEEARLSIWEDGGKMLVQVNDGPWPGDVPTYTINCPNDPPATLMFLSSGVGIGPGLDKQELAPGAKSFGGDYTTTMSSSSGMKRRYQYSFRVAP